VTAHTFNPSRGGQISEFEDRMVYRRNQKTNKRIQILLRNEEEREAMKKTCSPEGRRKLEEAQSLDSSLMYRVGDS